MAPHDGNTANDLGLPTFQAKREVLSPLPFRDILDDEDEDGEEELDDDAADELPDDIDPSSGVNFFRITEEDRVQNQRVVHKTVKELFDMVMSEKLDFKPEYQRDEVWTKSRQQGLIDSLFKGCPIPAIVLAAKKKPDGTEYFNVIDGKQRLTTIARFMSGKLAYKDKVSTSNKEFRYVQNTAADVKPHYLVPPHEKVYFNSREIICLEHYELPVAQEEDIFKRIQQGMTLVTGEKSSVGNTPRKLFIKELAAEYLAAGTRIATECNIDINRGRPFTNMASFIYCVDYLPEDRVYPTPQARGTWMDNATGDISDRVRERCKAAMDDFVKIATDHRDPFVMLDKRVAPVEFIFIAIYLYVTHDANISIEQRAREILAIRQETHSKFAGIVKSNAKLYEFLWSQVEGIAARPENGYERLDQLAETGPKNDKAKAKAKAATRKQKKEKKAAVQGDLRIEYDARMIVDDPAMSLHDGQKGNKRPISGSTARAVLAQDGEPSQKRAKGPNSRGPDL